ncbi:putative eukaryotic initiation factor-2 beta [Cardiosporidium cionae]|uniref:Eukaryotic initiation factor-2 beta n=1 Tax=Cardiosporidium cionae TaxID=476202 RepID=A0ABQ7J547_9APIC|nr:putative eukaryotic initiation factor-2 beta [Cardiosporidium cionae]|eukprot:KAF8819117.1 putative eukaryotic initiation factor-2 beta [Cardiosporidium cionae]
MEEPSIRSDGVLPAESGALASHPAEPMTFDFGQRRRKKEKSRPKEEGDKSQETDGINEVFVKGMVYPYEELLQRIQQLVNEHNPDLTGSKRYTIKPPQVVRVGSKKVAWINFKDICTIMNRNQDHVFQFVLAELGTEGSIAGDGQLVLKGKYGTKHIEALLRKYISKITVYDFFLCLLYFPRPGYAKKNAKVVGAFTGYALTLSILKISSRDVTEYVTCQTCKSPNTTMTRDNRTRLWQQSCAACGANRSVITIKSGFHALGRGERRKAKMG